MEDPQLLKWQAQLDEAKADLAQLGPMRPGSLSQQYRDPLTKVGAFWQLSYTHNMRSRSRHIRADELALIRPSSPTSSASDCSSTAVSTYPSRSRPSNRIAACSLGQRILTNLQELGTLK